MEFLGVKPPPVLGGDFGGDTFAGVAASAGGAAAAAGGDERAGVRAAPEPATARSLAFSARAWTRGA